jgi:hypothetical protein
MRATALVVDADAPVAGASRWGSTSHGKVTILVDGVSGGTICASRTVRLSEDRWLVRGMEIPISFDPERPDRFEVEWDAIPSLEDRAAANDSTLADPQGTRRRVAAALESAGVSGPTPGTGLRGMTGDAVEALREQPPPDRLEQSILEAAERPAPPGKQRAVVVISTIARRGASSSSLPTDPNTNGPP